MADLAGRVADGINLPGGPGLPGLLEAARDARLAAGREWASFVVTVSSGVSPAALDRLEALGVARAVAFVGRRSPAPCGVWPRPDADATPGSRKVSPYKSPEGLTATLPCATPFQRLLQGWRRGATRRSG